MPRQREHPGKRRNILSMAIAVAILSTALARMVTAQNAPPTPPAQSLEREGVVFRQCFYPHSGTETGPGHALEMLQRETRGSN